MNSGWPNQRFHDARFSTVAHDGGVVADAGVEAEEPPVDLAQADRAEVAGVDAVGQQLDGGDGVVGQPDRAGEHVRRAAGQGAERGVGAGDAGGHLVERAVAAEADDDVGAAAGGVVGEAGGVAAAVRLDELDVVVAAQPAVHDDRVAGRHRRREGVHHQHDAQGADGTSGPRRRPEGAAVDVREGWGNLQVVGNNERP